MVLTLSGRKNLGPACLGVKPLLVERLNIVLRWVTAFVVCVISSDNCLVEIIEVTHERSEILKK